MKFTVQYIPLSKINPNLQVKITDRIKKLQHLMWDCMHIIIVRKNNKDESYMIVSGRDRFEYLRKYTKHIYAPCIVDESTSNGIKSWINRLRNKQPLDDFPMMPKSWSIVRTFLKKEPHFRNLSRTQQMKVLILAIRYKKTVISTMKTRVNEMIKGME